MIELAAQVRAAIDLADLPDNGGKISFKQDRFKGTCCNSVDDLTILANKLEKGYTRSKQTNSVKKVRSGFDKLVYERLLKSGDTDNAVEYLKLREPYA